MYLLLQVRMCWRYLDSILTFKQSFLYFDINFTNKPNTHQVGYTSASRFSLGIKTSTGMPASTPKMQGFAKFSLTFGNHLRHTKRIQSCFKGSLRISKVAVHPVSSVSTTLCHFYLRQGFVLPGVFLFVCLSVCLSVSNFA